MRSLQRVLACVAVLIVCAFADRAASFMQFGAAVLVGDREVFAGEPGNNARPGTVNIYRKGANLSDAWREVATLTAPDAPVGDAFGSSLALGESRLFVGAGPLTVHVFEKRDTTWTFTGTIAAKGHRKCCRFHSVHSSSPGGFLAAADWGQTGVRPGSDTLV